MDARNFLSTLPFLLHIGHSTFAEHFEKDFIFKNVLDKALSSFEINNSVVSLSTYTKDESEALSDASFSSTNNSPSILSTALKLSVYIGINDNMNTNETTNQHQQVINKVPGLFFQIDSHWYIVNHLSIETISCPKSSVAANEFRDDTIQNNHENVMKSDDDRKHLLSSVLLSWTTNNSHHYPTITMRWWIPSPQNSGNIDIISVSRQHRQLLTQAVSIINQVMQPILPSNLVSSSSSLLSFKLSRWLTLSDKKLSSSSSATNIRGTKRIQQNPSQHHSSASLSSSSSSCNVHTTDASLCDRQVLNQFKASTQLLKLLNSILIINPTLDALSDITTEEITKNVFSSNIDGSNIHNRNRFDVSSKIYTDILSSQCNDNDSLSSSSSSSSAIPILRRPSITAEHTKTGSNNRKRCRDSECTTTNYHHSGISTINSMTASSLQTDFNNIYTEYLNSILSAADQHQLEFHYHTTLTASEKKIRQRLDEYYDSNNSSSSSMSDNKITGTSTSAITSPYDNGLSTSTGTSIKQIKEMKAHNALAEIEKDMKTVTINAANLMAAISLPCGSSNSCNDPFLF